MSLKRLSMAVATIEIELSVSRNGISTIFSNHPYDYVAYREQRDTNCVSRSCHAPVTLSVTPSQHDTTIPTLRPQNPPKIEIFHSFRKFTKRSNMVPNVPKRTFWL